MKISGFTQTEFLFQVRLVPDPPPTGPDDDDPPKPPRPFTGGSHVL